MGKVEVITGNYAISYAAKLARVQVVAAYPITPQTQIVERIAEWVEKGELEAKFIRVESEHSAMAAIIGASATGARAFTATSSHGLMYMSEVVWWAAASRLPIVMGVVNRALGPGWNIWSEHTDVLAHRDSGWIIAFAEDNQEALDTTIQAFRIAEDERVLLPVMVSLDAFILSHTAMPVDIPDQETIDNFLPPRKPLPFLLDPNDPVTHGSLVFPEHYMEFRYLIHEAQERAKKVILEVEDEYYKATGRRYGGLVDLYRSEDSDVIIVALGSSAGDAKEAVDKLRDEGYKVGVARIRFVRPWPHEVLREVLGRAKGVAVVDRNMSMGKSGVLYSEVLSTLYGLKKPPVVIGYIAGLGGRDIRVSDFELIALDVYKAIETRDLTPRYKWINLKLEVER